MAAAEDVHLASQARQQLSLAPPPLASSSSARSPTRPPWPVSSATPHVMGSRYDQAISGEGNDPALGRAATAAQPPTPGVSTGTAAASLARGLSAAGSPHHPSSLHHEASDEAKELQAVLTQDGQGRENQLFHRKYQIWDPSRAIAGQPVAFFFAASSTLDGTSGLGAGGVVDFSSSSMITDHHHAGVDVGGEDATQSGRTEAAEWARVAERRRSLSPFHRRRWDVSSLDVLPNEILSHILSFLDVCDLLATSRTNHHFRTLSLHPILHVLRLRQARTSLPPLLTSPSRPTLAELIARHIFLTNTTQISRRLARNLVAIRLSRRLPLRPSAESLVQRGVLPPEVVEGSVAPGLVARRRAVEKERLKDGLRRWVGAVWRGEVRERSEDVKKLEERAGIGRVWKLRRFWERVSKGDLQSVR